MHTHTHNYHSPASVLETLLEEACHQIKREGYVLGVLMSRRVVRHTHL